MSHAFTRVPTRSTTSATAVGFRFLQTNCLRRVRHIAAGLHSLGVRRGDRVAILSESRPEWTLTDAACMFAGAIDVPIYPTLSPPQVRYIVKDSGARVLVVQNEEKLSQLREILAECPGVEHVVLFDKTAAGGCDFVS